MRDPDEWTAETVLTVSDVVAQLREIFSELGAVCVEGEIGSLHRSRPGHVYFDLKDENAQLRAVLFRRSADRVGFELEVGMQVRAISRIDLYAERGSLQLVVEDIRPCGEGALRRAFEQMRARLEAEGLFDPGFKKEIPFLPRRIGIVTSLQGAAIHDFIRGIQRRLPGADLLVYDARVQGEDAWRELVRGLHLLDAQPEVDVIVLSRGGGSLEDLWNFNREELVRAVFELGTPVVSAVGHEVDVVLTDLVADCRAATPTAAAERVVPDAEALSDRVAELAGRLLLRQRGHLRLLREGLDALRRGLVHPARRLAESRRRLTEAASRLRPALGRIAGSHVRRLAELRAGMRSLMATALERRVARVEGLGGRLHALSPLAVLGRGYSIARRESDGAILKSSEQVVSDDAVEVRLARGLLRVRVTETLESG